MKRIIKLTESDLTRIVRRVINEQPTLSDLGTLPTNLNFKVGDTVQVTDGMGHLKINIEKITPKGYEGIISALSGNFGITSGQSPQVNLGVFSAAIIKVDGNNVSVTIGRYEKPIVIQSKDVKKVKYTEPYSGGY